METNVSIERAHEIITSRIVRLRSEEISVTEAAGRVLSRDLYCGQSIPAWPQSAVDGWALAQAGKIGDQYRISQDEFLQGRQACRVLTGGMLPEGAIAVVPEEKTQIDGVQLIIKEQVKAGGNIKQPGEDFQAGELLLPADSVVDWGSIAVLAAAGVHPIPAVRRPRVAVLSISDNLVPYQETLSPGFTRDCNAPLLNALVREEGGVIIGDDQKAESLTERLRLLAQKADVVLIIGGTYNRDTADARSLMLAIGTEVLYWGVSAQPGSHHGCGVYQGCFLLALSGNPAACAIGYHLFAAPLLRGMQGIGPRPIVVQARCVNSFSKPVNTRRLVRGRTWMTDQGWEVYVLPGQKPSMVRSLLHCNALLDLPAGSRPPEAGDMVSIILLDRNRFLLPAD